MGRIVWKISTSCEMVNMGPGGYIHRTYDTEVIDDTFCGCTPTDQYSSTQWNCKFTAKDIIYPPYHNLLLRESIFFVANIPLRDSEYHHFPWRRK